MRYALFLLSFFFFFSSRRRHTRSLRDWSSDVCSSDLFSGGDPIVGPGPWSFLCVCVQVLLNLASAGSGRSEEHTSELQSRRDLVCRLLLEKKMCRAGTIIIGQGVRS